MKTLFTILTIASLVFLSSCDLFDNDPELPPITTEGKGTFGCYVNGKLFLPKAPFGYGTGSRAEILINDTINAVNIYASNTDANENIFISILDKPGLLIDKTYDLTDANRCGFEYLNYNTTPSCRYTEVISGSIKLLKFEVTNPQRMIISGTFELTAKNVECGEISITSGRFDISAVTQ